MGNKWHKKFKAEYQAWADMKFRCSSPKHPSFSSYGGRGIEVCERWDSFDNFISDMGPRPSAKHSLDRIDNDFNYSPDNCRWATRSIQNINRRLPKTNTSGFRGVTRSKKKWTASIHTKVKRYNLGYYDSPEEAALAYNRKAYELWGEDAHLNQVAA